MTFRSFFSFYLVVSLSFGTVGYSAEVFDFSDSKENCEPSNKRSLSPKKVSGAQFTTRTVGLQTIGDAQSTIAQKRAQERDSIIFFITAPHDQENRGDTDYVLSVMRALDLQEAAFDLEYVRGSVQAPEKNEVLYDVEVLYKNNPLKNMPEYQISDSPIRVLALNNIMNYIKKFPQSNKIIHLQMRAPETGCMIHIGDIAELKKLGKLIITCHEWNHYNGTDKLRNEQVKQLDYLKEADHVMFLNKLDRKAAANAALKGSLGPREIKCAQFNDLRAKSSVSNISATLPTSKPLDLLSLTRKPPNVLIFGLIRPAKGFEQALKLAEKIKTLNEDHPLKATRIVIAGKPHDYKLVRSLVLAKYTKKSKFAENMDSYIEPIISEKSSKYGALRDITQTVNNISKTPKRTERVPQQLKDAIKIKAMVDFYNSANGYEENLPIDIYFSVDNDKLDELASNCKFCVKLEDKCFANNSSSIINALHRGQITFSRGGDITSKDFRQDGKFHKAINLCWDLKEEQEINYILETMIMIQMDDSLLKPILKDMQSCLSELYSEKKIRNDHLEVYEGILKTASNSNY